jgi:hypothetical protein
MHERIKAIWTTKLRNGEYSQATGSLQSTSGGFCCLGVLCDIYSKEMGVEWGKRESGAIEFDGSTTVLPPRVAEWAGLSGPYIHNPAVRIGEGEDEHEMQLAELNDTGSTFAEIADLIEAQL